MTSGLSHRERDDNYHGVIARLNVDWRIIACRDGIQWIIQRRDGQSVGRARWTGRCYCRTREALIRLCRNSVGRVDPCQMVILLALPDWFGGRP